MVLISPDPICRDEKTFHLAARTPSCAPSATKRRFSVQQNMNWHYVNAGQAAGAGFAAQLHEMREGLPPAGAGPMEYAGVGTRLAAKLLDALILGFGAALIIGVAAAVLIPLIARNRNQSGIFVVMLVLVIATVVFGLWFYQIWC